MRLIEIVLSKERIDEGFLVKVDTEVAVGVFLDAMIDSEEVTDAAAEVSLDAGPEAVFEEFFDRF